MACICDHPLYFYTPRKNPFHLCVILNHYKSKSAEHSYSTVLKLVMAVFKPSYKWINTMKTKEHSRKVKEEVL